MTITRHYNCHEEESVENELKKISFDAIRVAINAFDKNVDCEKTFFYFSMPNNGEDLSCTIVINFIKRTNAPEI